MATGLTDATIRVSADTRAMERDIAKSLRTVELSQINTKKSSQALGRITGQVSEFNKSLEASNARVIAFGASAGAIFAVERAIGSLITTTIEVEKKLQDVNVLLNLSSANLEKFGSSLFNIARNTAQSFTSVADAATELARQGLGVEETLRRTNAALVLARLSGLDTVKSVEALTATINSFSNSALDATQIVNKLANVDAAFAVSSADLANAISRVGSTAQDAGVSLDELISIVTAAQQTTARGGAVIGNSLKTIFTRLQRGKVQSLLESLGVDTGEGQSAVSLLQQLASVYDELSASQKSYVAEQVGGVFQINILKAALGDLGKQYSIYGRALDTSLSSTDQAIRRNEELNKTVAALSAQAVANLQQAADKIGSIVFEPNAKNFLSSINQLLESFNNIDAESQGGKFIEGFFKGISNFIGGPGTVLAVAVLTKLFVKLTQFAAGSARELLGRNEATKQQAALEQSVLSILQKNTQFTNQILSGKLSTVQAEKQLLSYLTAQSNIMKEQERLSKVIGGNLGRAGFTVSSKGIPTAPKSKSAGFVPNFASEMAVGQAMENAGAKRHGYKAGKARKTRIHDGNGKSFSSFVNSREDVVNFKNAAGKKATIVRPPNGFGENTEFAAGGFIPSFAANIKKEVIQTRQFRVDELGKPRKDKEGNVYKAFENSEKADPFDTFRSNIEITRQKKNIKQYNLDAEKVTSSLFKRLGKGTGKKVNTTSLNDLINRYADEGVDASAVKGLVTTVQKAGEKRGFNFVDVFNKVKGIEGEIDAAKLLKSTLTVGNSGFDLKSGEEVKTREFQPASGLVRKLATEFLAKNNIANNGPIPDEIDAGPLKVVMPLGSRINKNSASGFIPNFASKAEMIKDLIRWNLEDSPSGRAKVGSKTELFRGIESFTKKKQLKSEAIFKPQKNEDFTQAEQKKYFAGTDLNTIAYDHVSSERRLPFVSSSLDKSTADWFANGGEAGSFGYGSKPFVGSKQFKNSRILSPKSIKKFIAKHGEKNLKQLVYENSIWQGGKGMAINMSRYERLYPEDLAGTEWAKEISILNSGFVPNFAYKLKKYGPVDPVREILDEKTRSFLTYGEGRVDRGYPYLDLVGIDSKEKGQGLKLFSKLGKIAKRSGRKVRSSTIVPQLGRVKSLDPNTDLQTVLKAAYPQLLYRERSGVKNTKFDFLYAPVSGKGIIDTELSGPNPFSLMLKTLIGAGMNAGTLKESILSREVSVSSVEDSFAKGFIPNFAGAKMQSAYKMRLAGATEEERASSTFRSSSSKEAELKKGRVNVQNLGSLPYTMIHPGNEGLLSSGEIDFLKKDKKTGKPTRYFAKFNTSGLSSSEIAKQANASALQDRVSNYLLGEANQFARIFNPSASFSNIGQFSDRGAVMTAVGTVFESAIRKAFNQEAASKNQDFDFPAPNQQLREFFGNAPGPYEAKGSKTLPNLQSSLEKWVRSKGLAGGFIPNFASGIVTGDVLRGNEYKAVLDYLAKTSKPIRTILGPSGSGKTTMASNLGGKIVKSFKDLDVYSDYILDRSMLSFPKDPMIAESLKKIYSKSSQANALDLIVGSRSTIKSLREKRASQGDQFIPDRSQLPTGSGGVGSFTKGVRDFTSQYPGSSVSRIFKKGGSYGTRKILNSGFIPNLAAIKGLTFSRSKKDEFGFTNLVAKIDGKKVGAFEYSEDRPGVVDVGDITVDKPFRGKGIGQALYNEAIKVNSGKMMTGQILPQTSRFLAKIKADQPASAETLYPQMKRAQSAKKATFEVWGHKGMDEEMMNLQQFKSFVDSQIKRLKSDPDAFIDFFGDIQTGNYRGLGVKLNTQHAAGFIPNFAQISQVMALESAMSGEKATFHSKPFPHVRNKSQPTFGSAMADHGGLNNALKDSVKGQKSAGLLSGGFIPNFADGVASEDSSAAFAGILAGLQGIGFTALFLGKEMREAANNIKTAKKDIKDFGTTIQKTEAQTERIEKRKARLEKVAPTLTRNADINQARGNVASAIKLQREAKKTGSEADIEAANKLLANERRKLTKAENALKSKIQQRISSIDQSIQSNRQLINEQRNEVNERRKAIAQMRSQSRSSMLSQGGMIAQILAPQAASFIPQDTQGGRGAAAGVEALGNIAGMAGTGALIGGPIGAAAGAAVAALLEIPKIEKAFTSKMPELEKAVTAATESFTKFSEGGQIFLSASEKLSTIKADPNASSQDIIGAEQQYANALAALPTKYQDQLVAAERLGNAQQVYAQVLEELGREKQGAETIANTRKVFENNKTGFLGKIGDASLMAALQAAGGINTLTGGLATGFQMDFSDFENQINMIDYESRYGRSVSQEDMGSLVGQTYGFTRVSDDSTTAVNEALNAAKNFAQNLEKVQLGINKEGGVNEANFESQKSALTSALRAAFSESGGILDSNELDILEQLSSAINRPDQLEAWLSKYQSENNQFISAQEKIAEVNKAIAERQKKEAERVAKEKARADQRGARISASGANIDMAFKNFSYALEEALSKIEFTSQLEKNRGQFAAEIYDLTNVPNAARNRKEQNQLFEITSGANLKREEIKSNAAKDIFTNIGDAISSAALNESVISAMSDTEKTAAVQDFELVKQGFRNELLGSGVLDKILGGDTVGAEKDISALIDKMAATGNFTATQIQDLKNKTISELNQVEAGIKTSNRNEQQQKALLAQQLAFQRASQRIQEAQSFGGGAEEIIPNLLNDPNSLINQIKDSLAMTTGGGYNVNNLTKDEFGNIIDKTTGKAPALDSLGSLTDTLSKLTKFAGVPITSMGDTNFQAISQGYSSLLLKSVDEFEQQAGGALGPEVFKRIREQLSSLGTGKEGGADVAANLQLMQKLGVIDSGQYVDEVTKGYTDKEFQNLPKELQDAFKGVSGDTKLEFLGINKLTDVSIIGFGNVVTAIENNFDINKISDGIKAGLIANRVSEKKMAAEENAADSRLALSDAESNLDKNKEKLKTSEEKFKSSALELNTQFDRYGKKGFYNASSESFWNNSEEIKKLEDNFSSENIQMARTQLGAGQSVDQNRLFLDQAEAFNKAKSLRAEMMVARKNVSQSESDIVSAKGKANAAAALVQDYKSVSTDQAGLDKISQLYSENKDLAGKGFFTPGQNYMNPALLPKQPPIAPPTSPAQPSPIQQALATGGAAGGAIMQPNLNTTVGSINVPVSITMPPQAAAMQSLQETQAAALDQSVEQLRSEVQALAQKFASTQTELQNKGVVSPKPPTTPAVKPAGVAPK